MMTDNLQAKSCRRFDSAPSHRFSADLIAEKNQSFIFPLWLRRKRRRRSEVATSVII